jgi:DNA polymerase-3 subunit gamma/tau
LNEAAAAEPVVVLTRFEELIALAADKRDLSIKAALERDVRLVRFEDGQLEISVLPSAAKTLVGYLSRKLAAWTGRLVQSVLQRFPGAEIVDVRRTETAAEAAPNADMLPDPERED